MALQVPRPKATADCQKQGPRHHGRVDVEQEVGRGDEEARQEQQGADQHVAHMLCLWCKQGAMGGRTR
eukprot:891620-Pelagomonas_calceolata.AAC.2